MVPLTFRTICVPIGTRICIGKDSANNNHCRLTNASAAAEFVLPVVSIGAAIIGAKFNVTTTFKAIRMSLSIMRSGRLIDDTIA
jgi:hypothetical protein